MSPTLWKPYYSLCQSNTQGFPGGLGGCKQSRGTPPEKARPKRPGFAYLRIQGLAEHSQHMPREKGNFPTTWQKGALTRAALAWLHGRADGLQQGGKSFRFILKLTSINFLLTVEKEKLIWQWVPSLGLLYCVCDSHLLMCFLGEAGGGKGGQSLWQSSTSWSLESWLDLIW